MNVIKIGNFISEAMIVGIKEYQASKLKNVMVTDLIFLIRKSYYI